MAEVVPIALPVFLLILSGWLCRRQAFPGDGFWAPAERLTYFLLFPALLVTTLARADFRGLDIASMALAIAAAIVVMAAIAGALKRPLGLSGPAYTSVLQGTVRMNTYIGLSVAFGVHGTAGLAAAALAVATIVPLVNVLCVVVLVRHGRGDAVHVRGVFRPLATNPLLVACIGGVLLQTTGIGVPPVVGPMMEILGRAALPLGLLVVGAALDVRAVADAGRLVLLTTALKLVLLPALTWVALGMLHVQGLPAFVAVLFNALPTATSAYILARQLGGDAQLMASLITVQTFISVVSLPLVLTLLPTA